MRNRHSQPAQYKERFNKFKKTLKKIESTARVNAGQVNSYGLAYSAMTISNGWRQANHELITQIALNSGLITMFISTVDGMADILENNKFDTLRKDYRSLNASLGTFVFSLRAAIAAWVYIASDFGKKEEDITVAKEEFFILVGAMGLIGCLKFVSDLLKNHDFLAKKKLTYQENLELINEMIRESEDDAYQIKRADAYNRKIKIIEKLQKAQPIVEALFTAIASAGSLVGIAEFSTPYIFKTELKKHYIAQGACYLGSLVGGSGMALASYKFPKPLLITLGYMGAVLMILTLINSYSQLQKDKETESNAKILMGLWGMLLAMPIFTQSIRYCFEKGVDSDQQRLLSTEEGEDNIYDQDAPEPPHSLIVENLNEASSSDEEEIQVAEDTKTIENFRKVPSVSQLGTFANSVEKKSLQDEIVETNLPRDEVIVEDPKLDLKND